MKKKPTKKPAKKTTPKPRPKRVTLTKKPTETWADVKRAKRQATNARAKRRELERAVIPPTNAGARPLVGAAVATPRRKVRQPRPTKFGAWCQVRISVELAAAIGQLAPGVKSDAVRAALELACSEAGIPVATSADPNQLRLPIDTVRVQHTDGTLGAAHPIGSYATLGERLDAEAKARREDAAAKVVKRPLLPLLKLKPVAKARGRKVPK